MPVISNATVATGTGLSTAGNGGRKLVRLANGTLVSAVITTAPDFKYYKSTDNGLTWTLFYDGTNTQSAQDVSILPGTENSIYSIYLRDGSNLTFTKLNLDGSFSNTVSMDSGQNVIGNVSLAINEAGTEVHAAWSSKNATYPNSFNIRYAKGVINGDGSVTWGAVEQVTKFNSNSYPLSNPCIVVTNNKPIIFVDSSGVFINANELGANSSSRAIIALMEDSTNTSKTTISNSWKGINVDYNLTAHVLSNPSALFVPQSINGLANGRLWVAWHGKDATDSAKFNVRVSYSDDGGVTWATPVKLTSGNLYDRQNVNLAADKTGKVFALYEEHQWSPDLDIYMRTFSGGSWGAPVAVAEADPAAESNPSALVDYSLQMTTPPFVFTNAVDGIKFSGNFNVGAAVSPALGSLGNKETATLTAYTVTPEAGSTVTSIVEKVNGVTVNTFNNPASLSRTLTVPTATWDTIAYFASHTASITVTDSNGATTVTTYSFDKRLATGASLLEATKANTDAKNRISQKRDTLAAQVGLSAGSTFDAISAQLASGQAVVKRNAGNVTSSSSLLFGKYHVTIPIATIGFIPKSIAIFLSSNGAPLSSVNIDSFTNASTTLVIMQDGSASSSLDGTSWYINSTAVRLPVGGTYGSSAMKWIAYG